MTDLIKRADAIEAVAQQWLFEASVGNPYVNDDDIGEYRKLAEELFKDVPSADAVYGVWIPIEETLPTYDGGEKTWLTGMKCSNCGKLLDLRVGYYYCPTCGARMKGGAE